MKLHVLLLLLVALTFRYLLYVAVVLYVWLHITLGPLKRMRTQEMRLAAKPLARIHVDKNGKKRVTGIKTRLRESQSNPKLCAYLMDAFMSLYIYIYSICPRRICMYIYIYTHM